MPPEGIPALVDGSWHHLSPEGEEANEEARRAAEAEADQACIDILNLKTAIVYFTVVTRTITGRSPVFCSNNYISLCYKLSYNMSVISTEV